jgi:type I restriction enzyme, R subunit
MDRTKLPRVLNCSVLLRTLLSDQALLQQAKANTPKQFAESPDLRDSVLAAVAGNQGAHNKRADYFYGEGAEVGHLLRDIAWMVYEHVTLPEASESTA